jgi:hypothetical protein
MPSIQLQPAAQTGQPQPALGKGDIERFGSPLQLAEEALHIVADPIHHAHLLRPPQPPQGPLVPGPTIDDRLHSPAVIETPQLLKELAGLPRPSFPESLQVEDSPGGWINGGEDPALTPADLSVGREGQCDGPARSISRWMRLSILRKLTMLITPIQSTKNRILTAPLRTLLE